MSAIAIEITLAEGASLPVQAHPDDAGYDLHCVEEVVIEPGQNSLVGTGLAIALPSGYVGKVCSRSGLAAKHRVFVLNAPGIVDAGYRGEVKVNLFNAGDQPFTVKPGERIAQLLVEACVPAIFVPVRELDATVRGVGGHGSSGR